MDNEKVNQLKIEIFDIIREQEGLNIRINQLQEVKIQKAQELQKLEQGG